jgi:hypothetical protein
MIGVHPQPAPVANEEPAVWPLVIEALEARWRDAADPSIALLVIADMRERDRVGRERYGTPLQPNNGRNALVDAYHEALDLCAYLYQVSMETDVSVGWEFSAALSVVTMLRRKIRDRLSSNEPRSA